MKLIYAIGNGHVSRTSDPTKGPTLADMSVPRIIINDIPEIYGDNTKCNHREINKQRLIEYCTALDVMPEMFNQVEFATAGSYRIEANDKIRQALGKGMNRRREMYKRRRTPFVEGFSTGRSAIIVDEALGFGQWCHWWLGRAMLKDRPMITVTHV